MTNNVECTTCMQYLLSWKLPTSDLCSSYTSYQKPVIELGRIFIFFPSMLFSQPAKSIDLSLAQDEQEKLLKIWLSSSVIPPPSTGLTRTAITHWQVIHILHAFIYWPSILCCLYLYLTSHSIPVLSLSLSLSLAWPRLCTCHSSISTYQIWINTSACFFTHIFFLPPTSWKRQTIHEKRKSKIRKYLEVKKNYWSEDKKHRALRHHVWLLRSDSWDLFFSLYMYLCPYYSHVFHTFNKHVG